MSLYIINATKQDWEFHYRLGVHTGQSAPHVKIPTGQQREMTGLSDQDRQAVIRQLERYGARDAAEAHGALGSFHGILYRVNGQIETNEILMGHEAVVDTQEKRSVAETQKSALGFDRAVQAIGRGHQRVAKQTSVEVIEKGDPRERPTGKEINFNMAVDPEGGAIKLAS